MEPLIFGNRGSLMQRIFAEIVDRRRRFFSASCVFQRKSFAVLMTGKLLIGR